MAREYSNEYWYYSVDHFSLAYEGFYGFTPFVIIRKVSESFSRDWKPITNATKLMEIKGMICP